MFGNAAAAKPDIVVIGSGAEVGNELHAACVRKQDAVTPRTHVVLLADITDATELLLLRLALALGVDAILSKDISSEVLQRSLELVMLGQQLFPAQLFPASLTECPVETVALPEAELISVRPADATQSLIEPEQRETVPPRPNLGSGSVWIRSSLRGALATRQSRGAVPRCWPLWPWIAAPKPARNDEVCCRIAKLGTHKGPLSRKLTHYPNLALVDQQCSVMLSERESQILYFLTNGATNKAIARELGITEVHVKSLLRKIHANNRTQAAIWALNSNFVVAQQEPEPSHANGHLR